MKPLVTIYKLLINGALLQNGALFSKQYSLMLLWAPEITTDREFQNGSPSNWCACARACACACAQERAVLNESCGFGESCSFLAQDAPFFRANLWLRGKTTDAAAEAAAWSGVCALSLTEHLWDCQPLPSALSMDVISDLTTGICEVPDKVICPVFGEPSAGESEQSSGSTESLGKSQSATEWISSVSELLGSGWLKPLLLSV